MRIVIVAVIVMVGFVALVFGRVFLDVVEEVLDEIADEEEFDA